MDFDLWLFTIKGLSHSPMTAKTVYDNMPEAEKHDIDLEYINSNWCTWNEALIASVKGEPAKPQKMNFDLWLYAVKRLSQTMDSARTIYDNMTDSMKQDIQEEYEKWGKA